MDDNDVSVSISSNVSRLSEKAIWIHAEIKKRTFCRFHVLLHRVNRKVIFKPDAKSMNSQQIVKNDNQHFIVEKKERKKI